MVHNYQNLLLGRVQMYGFIIGRRIKANHGHSSSRIPLIRTWSEKEEVMQQNL